MAGWVGLCACGEASPVLPAIRAYLAWSHDHRIQGCEGCDHVTRVEWRAESTKIVHPGRTAVGSVFCKIVFDGRKLSITGVEGPKPDGDAAGSCGQIHERLTAIVKCAEGWTTDLVRQFAETWERWHLNDMRPGCEHQRAEGWAQRPIDPTKPTGTYGFFFQGQQSASWNMLTWIPRREHPEGLLAEPCPTCGYKYGTAWLYEPVPTEVLQFLGSLPAATARPAWV